MQILEKYGGKRINLHVLLQYVLISVYVKPEHFDSDYKLNQHDILYGISFDDAIANGTYRVDIHHAKERELPSGHWMEREIIFNDRTGPPIRRRWRKDNGYSGILSGTL